MIEYFKRTLGDKIIGLGYIDVDNPKSLFFQMFEDPGYYENEKVDFEEFKILANKYDFEGFKPFYNANPSFGSHFQIVLN